MDLCSLNSFNYNFIFNETSNAIRNLDLLCFNLCSNIFSLHKFVKALNQETRLNYRLHFQFSIFQEDTEKKLFT